MSPIQVLNQSPQPAAIGRGQARAGAAIGEGFARSYAALRDVFNSSTHCLVVIKASVQSLVAHHSLDRRNSDTSVGEFRQTALVT
jgi:hypothetical protein